VGSHELAMTFPRPDVTFLSRTSRERARAPRNRRQSSRCMESESIEFHRKVAEAYGKLGRPIRRGLCAGRHGSRRRSTSRSKTA